MPRLKTSPIPQKFWGTLTIGYELTAFTNGVLSLDLGAAIKLDKPITNTSGTLTIAITESEGDMILLAGIGKTIIGKVLGDKLPLTIKDANDVEANELEIPIDFACKATSAGTGELIYMPLTTSKTTCC